MSILPNAVQGSKEVKVETYNKLFSLPKGIYIIKEGLLIDNNEYDTSFVFGTYLKVDEDKDIYVSGLETMNEVFYYGQLIATPINEARDLILIKL